MATIGLDSLYYAKITEDTNGDETYGAPQILAKAMTAELSVELIEAILYANDAASEVVKEFKSGSLSLGVDDIGPLVAQDLTGCKIDSNNVVVSRSEDGGSPVAIGFRAKKSNGKYRHFWLYRVIFSIPATSLATKGDSITFSSPTIEGTVFRRNKLDGENKHPWKAEVTEGDDGVAASIITNWFTSVYEPDFTEVTPTITIATQPAATTEVTAGSITGSLSVVASSNTSNPVTYQWYENTVDSSTGGTIINGETSASFDIPTDLVAGTYYYYCVLSLSGAESLTTTVATVLVSE
jgi:phi13 family phage major tail protein